MAYDYNRTFWLVCGPGAHNYDPAWADDFEHVKECVYECGFTYGRTLQRRTFGDLPELRVIEVNPVTKTMNDITDALFADLFADELAEQNRPMTRAEYEGNRADDAWHSDELERAK